MKLITNDAQKNADNKEINKLKGVSSGCHYTLLSLYSSLTQLISVDSKHFLFLVFFFKIIAKLKRGENVDDAEVEE